MFENITKFLKKMGKKEDKAINSSKEAAKERLHLVLMQDRANVSADFLELMKKEIIEVIKKYIEVDEKEIDVRLTNKENADGTNGAPALYANIPIVNIKNETKEKEKEIKENKNKDKENKEKHKTENEKEEIKKHNEDNNSEKEENKIRREIAKKKEIKKEKEVEKKVAKEVEKIIEKNTNTKEESKINK